jgi:type IV secretion system protein TrbC
MTGRGRRRLRVARWRALRALRAMQALRAKRPRRPMRAMRPMRARRAMRARWVMSVLAVGIALAASPALAGTGGGGGGTMPWTAPMQNILADVTGPTGKVIAGLMIAIGGIVWGFTRHEEGAKRLAQGIVGIGMILGATSLVSALGFAGCLV